MNATAHTWVEVRRPENPPETKAGLGQRRNTARIGSGGGTLLLISPARYPALILIKQLT